MNRAYFEANHILNLSKDVEITLDLLKLTPKNKEYLNQKMIKINNHSHKIQSLFDRTCKFWFHGNNCKYSDQKCIST